MRHPNVLLLTIDTLRSDTLGCYDSGRSETPNLDRLAAEGLLFTQAMSGGSWTQAAFPAIMTSTYASMYGGCLGRLSQERPSPVEAMEAFGYSTAGFSTNPHLSRATGYDRGFRQFTDLVPDQKDPRLRRIKGGQRLLRNPLVHHAALKLGLRMRPARVYSPAAEVTDAICEWMDGVRQPFFAWGHYMDTHWPYLLERDLQHPDDVAQAWRDLQIMHSRANFKRDESITPEQRDRFVNLYRQSLHYLDAQIGRLLRHLDNSGRGSETIIIALSDHGEEFLEHGRWGHWESNLYDEIVKVPFIMRVPGWTGGQVIERQVRLLDLMPTILDLSGCRPPQNLEGTSLAPLWTGSEAGYDISESISEMHRPPWHRIALRTEAFKLIWDSKAPDRPELYDLIADPDEKYDVSDRYPHEVSRLKASVDAHLQRAAKTKPLTSLPEVVLDDEVIARLRDLGYVE